MLRSSTALTIFEYSPINVPENSTEVSLPANVGQVKAITVADASHRGVLDLMAVQSDGAMLRMAERLDASGWDSTEIAQVPDASTFLADEVRLHAVDLDNNGAIDFYWGALPGRKRATSRALFCGLATIKASLLRRRKIDGSSENLRRRRC